MTQEEFQLMLENAKRSVKKKLYVAVIALVLLAGLAIYLFISNTSYRKEVRAAKREIKQLHESDELLHQRVAELETIKTTLENRISEGTAIYDSLHTTLEKLNNQKIYVSNGGHLNDLSLDGEIEFLSRYIIKISAGQ